MKTWLVVPEFPLGGAERQMQNLKNSIEDDNYMFVSCKGTKDTSVTIALGINVIQSEVENKFIRRILRYKSLMRLFYRIRAEKVEQVVFYSPLFIPIIPLLELSGVKVCFSIREYKESLFKFYNRIFIKKSSALFSNTPRVVQILASHNINCKLILNSINFESTKLIQRDSLEKKYDVLVISNLEPHKNIHFLLKAAKNKNYTINIAGKISNPNYFKGLKKLAEESSCKINFLGHVCKNDLHNLLIESKCLIHPSLLEGTSNAILDGIFFEIPTLVSSIPENTYLVDDIEKYVFSLDSYDDLLSKIDSVLNSPNKNDIKYLKERVLRKFSDSNLDVIRKLL